MEKTQAMIEEIIVVEGRDDVTAVKRAVNAEVIAVHGFGITEEHFCRIERAAQNRGVIVLTDPDFAGETIRRRIEARIPTVRHAYISRDEGTKGEDVGVENASPAAIIGALEKAHAKTTQARAEFGPEDLMAADLLGHDQAKARRALLGAALGIGYGNARQMLSRLNHYGISRAAFDAAVATLDPPKK
ncbi:Ribonuclease M5 [Clostridiaceae bacterium JG1575]|nr:Ribonuclease M5 [Clostridiaceae bacterium JG1575]